MYRVGEGMTAGGFSRCPIESSPLPPSTTPISRSSAATRQVNEVDKGLLAVVCQPDITVDKFQFHNGSIRSGDVANSLGVACSHAPTDDLAARSLIRFFCCLARIPFFEFDAEQRQGVGITLMPLFEFKHVIVGTTFAIGIVAARFGACFINGAATRF